MRGAGGVADHQRLGQRLTEDQDQQQQQRQRADPPAERQPTGQVYREGGRGDDDRGVEHQDGRFEAIWVGEQLRDHRRARGIFLLEHVEAMATDRAQGGIDRRCEREQHQAQAHASQDKTRFRVQRSTILPADYENKALSERSLWIRIIASANSGATLITRTRARSQAGGSGIVLVTIVSTSTDSAIFATAFSAKTPWVAQA